MSSQDITRAATMLEGRLRVWGVENPAGKARDYVNDLVEAGWIMSPEREQRPHPPTFDEMCRLHPGSHANDCRGCRADQIAGEPRNRNAVRATQRDEYQTHVDQLRDLLNGRTNPSD